MIGLSHAVPVLALAAGGLLFGLVYFRLLRINTHLWLGGPGPAAALLLHLARVAAAGGLFLAAATQGAAPLLACFGGFLAARLIATRADRAGIAATGTGATGTTATGTTAVDGAHG